MADGPKQWGERVACFYRLDQAKDRQDPMIIEFADFCLWVYILMDDIWRFIAPLFNRPEPEPKGRDSELITLALVGECRGWEVEIEMLSQRKKHHDLFPIIPSQSRSRILNTAASDYT